MALEQQIQKDIMEAMKAKQQNEPCPFSEESLNELFGVVK